MNVTKKPWGSFQNLMSQSYAKVKWILIKPGESPSYQYHHKRSEVWVIVKGLAEIRVDGTLSRQSKGDIVIIPTGSKHQIKNIGNENLVFVEVQLGDYFGEDDIVRLEDKYGRI